MTTPTPTPPAARCQLDHLVVAAATLEQGVQYVQARLGCELAPGGRHQRMGTHNRLLSLGPGAYLEVIAIDPDAQPPQRARWFGLDGPEVAPLLASGPRLLTWVVACKDLAAAAEASPWNHGPAESMSRDGLSWQLTIPEDGGLIEHGLVPTLIQWPPGVHPAARLPDEGVRLERLTLLHPEPGLLRSGLEALELRDQEVVQDSRPRLRAQLRIGNREAILE
jgi:hypothetical protein